ncbi:branched-chain amino acid ABC transporter permease [Ornithinimicrobium murale]|uniref:branched-chain amino acid ABC transporter permease n=1 Tax=Ornithinimicrobium murale TaxID=1050153 RepID=UPI000E0D371A|nr:branched-chain amino acid ABC transporter permease [Ornithinimicrobium murale]
MNEIIQTTVGGLTLGAQYALMALGFSLAFGILRVINFAHGALYVVGGYVAYFVTGQIGLPYVFGVMAAVLATAAIGYLFELFIIERRIDDHLATIVLTLGLSLIGGAAMLGLFGPQAVRFPPVVSGTLQLGGVYIPYGRILVIVVAAFAIAAVYLLLYKTQMGGALRALTDDREMAIAMGMRPKVLFPLAFAIAAGLAGLTGALVTPQFSLAPFVGEHVLMISFLAVILGGLGSLPGAVIASVLVGLVESFVGVYVGGSWAPLILFTGILVLLVIRPTGILGHRTVNA